MYDVIIVGAGPSGLFMGCVLEEQGIDFVIMEQGEYYKKRDKNIPSDVSYGVGGAGLYSDGKLSYAPSASNLWTKLKKDKLKRAYQYVKSIFEELEIDIKEWDDKWTKKADYQREKKYDSSYLSEKQRYKILDFIERKLDNNIIYGKRVLHIDNNNGKYSLECENEKYYAKTIIIATGKSSSLKLFSEDVKLKSSFCSEMGIRLEVPKKNFIPNKKRQVDYKIIEKIDETTEKRTFCCCKNGTVRKSVFNKKITYNGETISEESKYSNIGVVIRSTDENSEYARDMQSAMNYSQTQEFSLKEYGSTRYIFGAKIDRELKEMVSALVLNTEEGKVYGPEIERYGYYPKLDTNLCGNDRIYFIGDATGSFRGLMAAIISGAYMGMVISDDRKRYLNDRMNELNIKQSNTSQMKLIFTAQSKAFFYCRDVVCQYVLEQEFLPLNPFRVFGYFLGDRVDRDLIRRGNNQLIKECAELWVFGPIADGVLFEIASAIEQGKAVRFFTIGTRVEDIKEIDIDQVTFEPEVHAKKIKKMDLIDFIKKENVVKKDGQISLFDYWEL